MSDKRPSKPKGKPAELATGESAPPADANVNGIEEKGRAAGSSGAPVPLVKVNPPNPTEHKEALTKIDDSIKALQFKVNTNTKLIDEKTVSRQSYRDQRKEIISKMKDVSHKRAELVAERNKLNTSIEELEEEKKKAFDSLNTLKKSMRYNCESEVDAAIAAIEYRLNTSTLPLKVEKDLIGEIADLRKSKDSVRAYAEAKSAPFQERLDTTQLRKQRDVKSKEIKQIRDSEDQQSAVIKELKSKEQAVNTEIVQLLAEKRTAQTELRELRDQRAQLIRTFEQQQRAFERYQEQLRFQRAQAQRKDRQRQYEERRKQIETEKAELLPQHPYQRQLSVCEELLRYLKRIAPIEEENELKDDAGPTMDNRASLFASKEVAPLVSRKKGDDFFLSEVAKPKPAPKKKAKPRKTTKLTHIPDVFAQFEEIGLVPPLDSGELPASIKALTEKLQYYQTAPPPLTEQEKKEHKRRMERESQERVASKELRKEEAKERSVFQSVASDLELAEKQRIVDEERAALEEDLKAREEAAKSAVQLEKAEQAARVQELQESQKRDEAERLRARRRSIAMEDEEQKRRLQELELEKATAAAAEARERRSAREKAQQMETEEQARRVAAVEAERKAIETEEQAERTRRRSVAIELESAEQTRRVAEFVQEKAKHEKEAAALAAVAAAAAAKKAHS